MAGHHESELEREICEYLEAHGWLYSPDDTGYDRDRALFPDDVVAWLSDTQPDALARVVNPEARDSAKQRAQLLDRLGAELDKPMPTGGTLAVLRRGFKHLNSGTLQMAQFQPESTLNPATVERYTRNRLRVMRQVHYAAGGRKSLDLVFFLNGIPIATAELKTENTQTVETAKRQYRTDRLPAENGQRYALLGFGIRALVHFAVSEDEVWMTTKLAGAKTFFLPFNLGDEEHGAGNPANPYGRRTDYLWQRVFQRDAILAILGRYMYIKTERKYDADSKKFRTSTSLRFPRFHQWEAVEKLSDAVAEEGVGHRYLIQHSAGSGKTDSIAWTAHRMARMQVDNRKVFDSVIVVTDRNVLDAQLQEAIKQLDKHDIVTTVDAQAVARAQAEANDGENASKSTVLAHALSNGRLIIVVTIQTFPHILDEVKTNAGLHDKTFAVIADEAHSSQSGQVSSKLKAVLSAEEQKDLADGGEIDTEAVLAAEMTARAESPNISYFAFTATPKSKTLELFGRVPEGGDAPEPFHLYSMKQAIEEGFIIDVLRGYHSYKMLFELGQRIEQNEDVDQAEASKALMKWVKLNPQTISQKSAVIVEHFKRNVAHLLEGRAKAMVVAESRKAAVKYKFAIDDYIRKHGLGYQTLVAFSGSVQDEELGIEDFTEASLNPGAADLRTAFMDDDCRVMIVANKFQTGFDQPLLCAMYVDKRLSGISAVQTLSRLNRTHVTPSGIVKDASMTHVVDFVNDPAEIQASFEVYYRDATLETTTDPNLVHDLLGKLDAAEIYTPDEVEAAASAVVAEGAGAGSRINARIQEAITPAKKRFSGRYSQAARVNDRVEGDKLELFRKNAGSFLRLYDFISQIYNFHDPDIEKRAIYLRLLLPNLSARAEPEVIDLSVVELTRLQIRDEGKTDISLTGEGTLKPAVEVGEGSARDPKRVALEEVIVLLNERFSGHETHLRTWIESVTEPLKEDDGLVAQARNNSLNQFEDSPEFADALSNSVAETHETHAQIVDLFFSSDPATTVLKKSLLRYFYEVARDQQKLSDAV